MVHDADRRLTSFEGEFEDWGLLPPSNILSTERDDPSTRRPRFRVEGPGLYPRPTLVRRRIWFESSQRLRVEIIHDGTVIRFGVRHGAEWWRWDSDEGTSSGRHGTADTYTLPTLLAPTLLTPMRVLSTLSFAQIGVGVRLGRKVWRARAVSRDPAMNPERFLEFEFDAEYGTILRREIVDRGHSVQRTEAIEVHFGVNIDPGRFVFDPQ